MKPHYLYDGSFEGLLTVVHEAYYRHSEPEAISIKSNYQAMLTAEPVEIITDSTKAEKVSNAIKYKISPEALENCYHTYLSELENCELWIYQYLRLGFRVGPALDRHLTDDRVKRILDTSYKVTFERHRYTGILRFSLVGPGTFFAPVEPDHNVLPILAPHFADRFADQNWVIYDVKRKLAAVYDRQDWFLESDVELSRYIGENGLEELYQDLWRLYFNNISIQSRKNPRCQKNHMPVRYWKYLPEKQQPLNKGKLTTW